MVKKAIDKHKFNFRREYWRQMINLLNKKKVSSIEMRDLVFRN
jgi:hypothetical protein